jgi:hypothetical protein
MHITQNITIDLSTLSDATRHAIRKQSINWCVEAYRWSYKYGHSDVTIGHCLLHCNFMDAREAVAAGREIVMAAERAQGRPIILAGPSAD